VYYDERVIEGTVAEDVGANLRDGIKVLAAGIAPEALWPYDVTQFAVAPPPAYRAACVNQALAYEAVEQTADAIEAALAAGCPVVLGFTVYGSFESDAVAQSGVVPMPGPNEPPIGGHAVCLVGYDHAAQLFLMRNSWGPEWGQGGYGQIPYAYVLDPNQASDLWALSKVQEAPSRATLRA
jgi:hypothetical protein